ncbi:MAG: hypothetical protein ACTHM1_04475 [Solirubrobacteraceae bacterium]
MLTTGHALPYGNCFSGAGEGHLTLVRPAAFFRPKLGRRVPHVRACGPGVRFHYALVDAQPMLTDGYQVALTVNSHAFRHSRGGHVLPFAAGGMFDRPREVRFTRRAFQPGEQRIAFDIESYAEWTPGVREHDRSRPSAAGRGWRRHRQYKRTPNYHDA